MHELPFAKSIFHSVVEAAENNQAKAVTRVDLEVGVLRDFIPDLVNKYWAYVTRGSLCEGSVIHMTEIPATVRCRDCQRVYTLDIHDVTNAHCPDCGCLTGTMLTGRELRIVDIEIR